MYGVQTTGKPVKIISKVAANQAAHYYEIQIDTKKNEPQILNGRRRRRGRSGGEKRRRRYRQARHSNGSISRTARGHHRAASPSSSAVGAAWTNTSNKRRSPIRTSPCTTSTRDECDRLSALGGSPAGRTEGNQAAPISAWSWAGSLRCLHDEPNATVSQFFDDHLLARDGARRAQDLPHGRKSRPASAPVASAARKRTRCTRPFKPRASPLRRPIASRPSARRLILKGLHQVVPGEFYAAATRPPAVYRGNPFQIEVGIAYGGQAPCSTSPRNCSAN